MGVSVGCTQTFGRFVNLNVKLDIRFDCNLHAFKCAASLVPFPFTKFGDLFSEVLIHAS